MSDQPLEARLWDEDQVHAAEKGLAFARDAHDLPEPAWQAAVNEARALIREALEAGGAECTAASQAADVFSRAAVIERRRFLLEVSNPRGSA